MGAAPDHRRGRQVQGGPSNKADLPEVRIPADIIVVAIGGASDQGFEQAGVPIKRGTFVAGLSGQVGDMDNCCRRRLRLRQRHPPLPPASGGSQHRPAHLGWHEIKVGWTSRHAADNRAPTGRINTTERAGLRAPVHFGDISAGSPRRAREPKRPAPACGATTTATAFFRGGRNEKW